MKQMSMATAGFEKHARPTRKAEFLAEMERLMPWAEICALIEPHYPKAGNGRPPVGLDGELGRWWSVTPISRRITLPRLLRGWCKRARVLA